MAWVEKTMGTLETRKLEWRPGLGPEVLCLATRADRFWDSPAVEPAVSQVKAEGVRERGPLRTIGSQYCGSSAAL